jgi:hypothetical protein
MRQEDRLPANVQARRYQRAAEVALEQLDWCIRYLRQIRKNDVATVLSRNRDQIERRVQARSDSEVGTKR